MKKNISVLMIACSVVFQVGCVNLGSAMQQNTVLVDEVVSICGQMVGDHAEQRINREWAKYPVAEANRPLIEAVAKVLLTNPHASAAERSQDHRQYLTCATGLLVANGVLN